MIPADVARNRTDKVWEKKHNNFVMGIIQRIIINFAIRNEIRKGSYRYICFLDISDSLIDEYVSKGYNVYHFSDMTIFYWE